MLPLGDLGRPHRMPWVTLALLVANMAVWLAYQLPHGVDASVETLGFRACSIGGGCADPGLPWVLDLLTSMFTHGSWAHVVGNVVFLVAFGTSVENLVGPVRYLGLYLAAGIAGSVLWGTVALAFAPSVASVPGVGASGAISGVLGAYLVALPFERIVVWIPPVFFLSIPAIALLGVWFAVQALEGSYELGYPSDDVGVAFFAHVGGFLAGFALAVALLEEGWPRTLWSRCAEPTAPSA